MMTSVYDSRLTWPSFRRRTEGLGRPPGMDVASSPVDSAACWQTRRTPCARFRSSTPPPRDRPAASPSASRRSSVGAAWTALRSTSSRARPRHSRGNEIRGAVLGASLHGGRHQPGGLRLRARARDLAERAAVGILLRQPERGLGERSRGRGGPTTWRRRSSAERAGIHGRSRASPDACPTRSTASSRSA